MIEINKRNARAMARMGTRPTYGQAVSACGKADKNVIALSADLGRSSGLDRFSQEYPDQFINTGIAEQNMVGIAAGLARTGFDVFASTFAPFASMRASEQVRMNMGYMREPVKLVALGSGLSMGFLGNSHYGLEDLAVLRAIPNITIVSPADCSEIHKVIQSCVGYREPVYIRLTGGLNAPVVYEEDYQFQIGKAVWLRQGGTVCLLSSGTTVGHCLAAARELEQEKIDVSVLNMHTIKPLDHEALQQAAEQHDKIFIVEEHFKVGGLGDAVVRYYNDHLNHRVSVHCHGIKDMFLTTGDYPYLLQKNKLDSSGIACFVREQLS